MSANTKIEWADHTFNPWIGCTKISPACDHCYAARIDHRFGGGHWGAGAPRKRTKPANWKQPLRWNRQAAERGVRYRVFCASLADVFDNEVPVEWRLDLFDLIRETPHLDWLLLTKRIGNVEKSLESVIQLIESAWPCDEESRHELLHEELRNWLAYWLVLRKPPANVWLGATVVNQAEADRDVPKLLATPAAVRFLSIEPMLGPIDLDLSRWGNCYHSGQSDWDHFVDHSECACHLDWIIAGGESGPQARPSHPDWFRSLRDQCADARVPFLFKQWGEWGDGDAIEAHGVAPNGWWELHSDDGGVRCHEWAGPVSNGVELASMRQGVYRVGKKAAGRLLDGRTWDQFPNGGDL